MAEPYSFLKESAKPDNRKLEFYSALGTAASKSEFRAIGLKSFEAWQSMFPSMFDNVGNNVPAVSERSAQRIAAVFTCLNILGETEGSLPFSSKINGKNGPETEYNNPVHRLIHDRPNEYTSAFDFWSTLGKWRRAWGNAYAEIIRDSSYTPTTLIQREPWEVEIKQTATGELYYYYKQRAIRSVDMLHFKNYSLDGICGVSSIRENALTMGQSMKLTQYNNSIIGERPYGYLTSATRPKDLQQKANQRNMWDKRNSATDEVDEKRVGYVKNIAGIPYLYGGLEFKSFTLPADDVAYIESSKLTTQDIYGIFRIPPTLAENYEKAPYNSSEQQDIVFVKYSLASIRGIEQECTEKLFSESNKQTGQRYCKFSLNGLLRGDMASRKEFYNGLFSIGALTPNQICELEDLPTYGKDGDRHYVQGAYVPVELLEKMIIGNATNKTPQSRADILAELREKIKPKLNGHWKEIEEYLS